MIKEPCQLKEFRPFPAYSDRKAWEGIRSDTKEYYTSRARELKGYEWPLIPAVLLLDFYRNGNRTRHGERYYGRRQKLITLLIAECIEGKGAYLDDILNGVWAICEETSWVIPAHLNHGHRGEWTTEKPKELPDIEDSVYVDLFAAETGSLLSWIYYFLGDAIAGLSPLVKRRIEVEVERRLLVPYLEHDDFPWMGLDHEDPVNNWNPWINSNMLVSYLIFSGIFSGSVAGVAKTVRSTNRFLYFYAEDGGCDEGPSYFSRAGASLFDYIEELGQVTDVSYLYADPKIHNIAAYIYKVYIGNTFYVNYADASPTVFVPVGVLERAAKNTGNDTLLGFTAHLREHNFVHSDALPDGAYTLFRQLSGIFAVPVEKKVPLKIPAVNWFKGIQVLTAREHGDSSQGFFFSAKGGHNNESHNHNDVGNFLLYCDGAPVLVDAGVETYTKFTFNEKRYTLWAMQSCNHNTPTINGADQLPGLEHQARDVSFSEDGGAVKFSLDIAPAYPAEAGIRQYRREFVFRSGEGLTLTDTYSLDKCVTPLVLNFLCYEKPEVSDGLAVLGGRVMMEFESGAFSWTVDEIALTDSKMHNDWQQKNSLFRLRLTWTRTENFGTAVLRFKQK